MNRIPLVGPYNIFTRLFITDIIILFIYPISAAALYSVKKWGWYLFLGCVLILIGYNIFVYFHNPRYNLSMLIIFNVILAIVAGIFFRKHVIAPYFNPRLRWWETKPRFKIDIHADLMLDEQIRSGDILDLSMSGFFMAFENTLSLGQVYTFDLKCLKRSVKVTGRVMRKSTEKEGYDGFGIMFVRLTENEKTGINSIIKDLEKGGLRDSSRDRAASAGYTEEPGPELHPKKTASRYTLAHDAVLSSGNNTINCRLLDISKNGCLITAEQAISAKQIYKMNIRCMNLEIEIDSRLQRKAEPYGTKGYAMEFVDISKEKRHSLNILIQTLKKMGAKNRLEESTPLPDAEIEKTISGTPYRIVLFFRKLILKDIR
jgi:c-di-GMP-binding flagellar brake protein YcgR